MNRSMLLALVATILLLVWFNDVFVGYYVFVKECERSGGVKFNGVIDVNDGWLVSDEASAQSVVSSFPSIPFARFKSADGQLMDVEYTGGNPWWERSYNKKKADDRKVLYRWLSDSSLVPNKIRLMSFTDMQVSLFERFTMNAIPSYPIGKTSGICLLVFR